MLNQKRWLYELQREADQLFTRYDKLSTFIESSKFEYLDITTRELIQEQQYHMKMYLETMYERIRRES